MDNIYSNIDDYNPKKKRKILVVFDDMIADIMTNTKFQAIINELFIRFRKLNISLFFIKQSYFRVPKGVRLNSTHFLIHSVDVDYKDFVKICRNCTNEPYSFLTIDTKLTAKIPLRFRKIFSDSPL